MQRRAVRWTIGLLVVAGCAGVNGGLQEPDWQSMLQTVQARKEHGEVGTVKGLLYLRQPGVPTPLWNTAVTLIPLPPRLENTVAEVRARYAAGGFQPLAPKTFAHVHRPITTAVRRLRMSKYRDLVLETKTASSADPEFRFEEVPTGRWLLLTELHSSFSTLLWAVPITVTAGAVTRQSLNDDTVWIEGLTPIPEPATRQ